MKQYQILRTAFVLATLSLLSIRSAAQGQKEKYIKGLIQSIALYQTYISRLTKGYTIVKRGLNLIGDIKNGEFSLHKDYFSSLDNVNPKIRSYTKTAAIAAFQAQITIRSTKLMRQVTNADWLSRQEIAYFQRVVDRLLEETGKNLDELALVITSGKLKMTDDERIRRIDQLYEYSASDYSFLKEFSFQVATLNGYRLQEHKDNQVLNGLYDTK